MAQVSPTRTELLATRGQIALAEQGHRLLDGKRGALLREINRLGADGLRTTDELAACARKARRALTRAVAVDGPEAVVSASLAAGGDLATPMHTRHVAGVGLAQTTPDAAARTPAGRGYAPATTSARIDAAAAAHERVVDMLLDAAMLERSLRRLAVEIAATTRRMNALEHVVLPRLTRQRDRIALVLDEREREDAARLRRVKHRAERQEAA